MSTSSTENQSTPANPYTAPKSAASPFAKSYLTLAACSGLAAVAVLGGIWIYAQSASSDSEKQRTLAVDDEIFMHRAAEPPVDHMEPTTAAPAFTSGPTAP